MTKRELIIYAKGYIECMRLYAIYKDGSQYVGIMQTPINEAINKFLESKGLTLEDITEPLPPVTGSDNEWSRSRKS